MPKFSVFLDFRIAMMKSCYFISLIIAIEILFNTVVYAVDSPEYNYLRVPLQCDSESHEVRDGLKKIWGRIKIGEIERIRKVFEGKLVVVLDLDNLIGYPLYDGRYIFQPNLKETLCNIKNAGYEIVIWTNQDTTIVERVFRDLFYKDIAKYFTFIFTFDTTASILGLSYTKDDGYFAGLNGIFKKLAWFKPISLFFNPKGSVMVDDDSKICEALIEIGCNTIRMNYSTLSESPEALIRGIENTLGRQLKESV